MTLIAGHTFNLDGRCTCGRTWPQIAGATLEDVGQKHIAHTGELNTKEAGKIADERERIWATVAQVAG